MSELRTCTRLDFAEAVRAAVEGKPPPDLDEMLFLTGQTREDFDSIVMELQDIVFKKTVADELLAMRILLERLADKTK